MSKQEILNQIEKIDKNLQGGKLDSEQVAFVEKKKAKLQAQLATLEAEEASKGEIKPPKEEAPKEAAKPKKEKKAKKPLVADDADCDDAYKALEKANEQIQDLKERLSSKEGGKPSKPSKPKTYPNKVKKFASRISTAGNNLFTNVIEAVKNQSKPKKDGEIDETARPNHEKALGLIENAKVNYKGVDIPFIDLVSLFAKGLAALKIGFSEKNLVDVEMFTTTFENLKKELEEKAKAQEEKEEAKKEVE